MNLTDAQIDAMLQALDEIARDYDQWEYGLPMRHDEQLEAMRRAVRAAESSVTHTTPSAAAAMTASLGALGPYSSSFIRRDREGRETYRWPNY